MGPEVLRISGLFNGLQKSGTENRPLFSLCFLPGLPHLVTNQTKGAIIMALLIFLHVLCEKRIHIKLDRLVQDVRQTLRRVA